MYMCGYIEVVSYNINFVANVLHIFVLISLHVILMKYYFLLHMYFFYINYNYIHLHVHVHVHVGWAVVVHNCVYL